MTFKKNIIKIGYTLRHYIAYHKTAMNLGVWHPRFLLHDLDKVLLLLIGMNPKSASRLHRSWSRHHEQNGVIRDVIGAVVDWECARVTKPDKPLNAVQTAAKYYPNYLDAAKEIVSGNINSYRK